EVALGGARVAPGDDGDAFPAVTPLGERGAGSHRVLDLDGTGDGNDVPFPLAEVTGEVPPARVRVARAVLHLPERADGVLPGREQGSALTVVAVEVVEIEPLAPLHEQAEGHVESFFPRSTDPEIPVTLPVHLDESFLQHPRLDHQVVEADEELRV